MAEAPAEQVAETEALSPRILKALPLLLAVLATGIGGALGLTLVGPAVAPWLAARASEEGESGKGGHGGGHGPATTVHQIENLVVNPAGSEGMRYLLVSVAIEPHDPRQVEALAARDVVLRHNLLEALGSRTVPELADIRRREEMLEDLKTTVDRVMGRPLVSRIYLPQYVIQ